MTSTITEGTPSDQTLVSTTFEQADYRDAFVVSDVDHLATIDDVATAYFLGQPRWLRAVSMNLLSRQRLVDALGNGDHLTGSSVGSWQVRQRSDDEIVFGDHMGFMDYCFSLWQRPDGSIEASTVVSYAWPRASRMYFALVKPMHRRFVPRSLRALSNPAASDLVGVNAGAEA